jgi:uncharacterized protein YegL
MADGMVRERLNIYYLLDTSGSMSGQKIQQLNTCMETLKSELEAEGIKNNVEIVVRVIEFGNNDDAKWTVGSAASGNKIDEFIWTPLQATGACTPTSKALTLVADALNDEFLGKRTLRPVIILVSDGVCTDGDQVYVAACEKLAAKIGGVATRIAVAVQADGTAALTQLEQFASHDGETKKPFVYSVESPEDMVKIIRWASIVSIKSSVKTGALSNASSSGQVSLPDPDWI